MLNHARRFAVICSLVVCGAAIGVPSAYSDSGKCVKTEVGVLCGAEKPGKSDSEGKSKKEHDGEGKKKSKGGNDPCSYRKYEEDVPAGDPAWKGNDPNSGALMLSDCPGESSKGDSANGDDGGMGPAVNSSNTADAPDDDPPPPSPEELAQEAYSKMKLKGPVVQTAPGDGKLALVKMPVWLWLPTQKNNLGPKTTSASAGDVTVTAKATVAKVKYDMGDGSTITCDGPGTPYEPRYGDKASPDCGHRYQSTSANQPGGHFTIKATAVWSVNWKGGGTSGSFDVTPSGGSTTLRVGELQVVN